MFTQDFIERLKRDVSINELVQSYVSLKKKGRDYWAPCPFHYESTPSFKVDSRGFFCCHGCGAKGDMFNFIEKIENVPFPAAVKRIAEFAGIEISETPNGEKQNHQVQISKKRISEINKVAKEFWIEYLTTNVTEETQQAWKYLYSRGLDDETIKKYEIGFAPGEWSSLNDYLLKMGFSQKLIYEAGLSKENSSGNPYDLFRGRIIFPVNEHRGLTVAFNGRSLETDSNVSKYLNSPETDLYVKGEHLYGLNISQEQIRRTGYVIITEGPMDKIRLDIEGVENVVANMGTSLTPEQAKLLKRYTNQVLLCYDGDDAGRRATSRAIGTLLEQGFIIKTLSLPQDQDPDDYITKNGISSFNSLRKHSKTFLDFLFNESKFTNPEEKITVLENILEILKKVQNPVVKRDHFEQTMEYFGVHKEMRDNFWSNMNEKLEHKKHVASIQSVKPTIAEMTFFELIIPDAKLHEYAMSVLVQSDIQGLVSFNLLSIIMNSSLTEDEMIEGINKLRADGLIDSEIVKILDGERLRFRKLSYEEKVEQLNDCIEVFRQLAFESTRKKIQDEIKFAEERGDHNKVNILIQTSINMMSSFVYKNL